MADTSTEIQKPAVIQGRPPHVAAPWLDALAAAMDVGVVVLDAGGALRYVSPTAYALIGCSDAGAAATHWESLRERVMTRARSGGPVDVSVTAPGAGVEMRLRCELQGIAGEAGAGALILIRARERADAVDAAFRLATRYRTLAALHATAAHDVKGALNALALNLELVRRTAAPSEPRQGTLERALGALQREIDRLGDLVASILDESRRDSSAAEPIDCSAMAASIAKLIGPSAARQGIAVEVRTPPAPLEARGRADWIQQALLNLAHNALDAMPDGGRLLISVEEAGHDVVTTVADTGPGIPADAAPHVFDLHFTTQPGGRGLGLYVARQVALAHQGDLTLMPAEAGAAFQLRLPRSAKTM
jgi:signal transduction histidine kinase